MFERIPACGGAGALRLDCRRRGPRHSGEAGHHGDQMQAELRIRRAAAGGFVLLLHIVALLALLAAFKPQLFQQTIGTREITVSLPIVPETRRSPPETPTDLVPPTFLAPGSPRAITLPSLEAPPAAEQQPEGDIRALGRYLY